jgi:hypothetical protein
VVAAVTAEAAHLSQREWTKKDLVLWGLGMCGGNKGFVDTETVGVYLFERLPALFSLKKYHQYPDIDATRVLLTDWKKAKDAPVMVVQDTDERKRQARARGDDKRILSREALWKLNEEGNLWFDRHRDDVGQQVESIANLGVRRGGGTLQATARKISAAVLERIHRRPSFGKFQANPKTTFSEKDLSILDFFAVFNVDAHTPEPLFEAARTRTLEALDEASIEGAYVHDLLRLYAHRYRTHYDEVLAQGS